MTALSEFARPSQSGQPLPPTEGLSPAELLHRAIADWYPGRIALVSSFGADAAVLLHLVASIEPRTPILFLDTGKLFDETLLYRDALASRLGLSDVRSLRPDAAALDTEDPDGLLWFRNPDRCCALRKVEPLARALAPFDAWINGRKRFQADSRAALPLIEADGRRVKLNPLANWTRRDIAAYFTAHDLPPHPLLEKGYRSIGCAPCTLPVAADEDERAGRWRGRDKTECGIHTIATSADFTRDE